MPAIKRATNRGIKMFDVAAVSDLFDAGKDNDGQVFAAEVYYVVIENGAGRRWASYDRFRGARREVDEEGWVSFDDLREEASAAAEALAAATKEVLASGGKLSLEDWYQIDPAYGSRAYQADGIEEIRKYEERYAA
jgi:hypothetical protein